MAFPESDIVTGQGVVTVLFYQCLFFPESLKDIFKEGQIFAPLIDTLQIFSELGGHYKIKYAQYPPQENR